MFETLAQIDEDVLFVPGCIPSSDPEGGSLLRGVAHLVAAESHWLRRWLGDSQSTMADAASYESLDAVIGESSTTSRAYNQWLSILTDDSLAADCRFFRSDGSEDAIPLWLTLLHVSNHSTHHRGELYVPITGLRLAAALKGFGADAIGEDGYRGATVAVPPSVDMIDWIRAAGPGAPGVR